MPSRSRYRVWRNSRFLRGWWQSASCCGSRGRRHTTTEGITHSVRREDPLRSSVPRQGQRTEMPGWEIRFRPAKPGHDSDALAETDSELRQTSRGFPGFGPSDGVGQRFAAARSRFWRAETAIGTNEPRARGFRKFRTPSTNVINGSLNCSQTHVGLRANELYYCTDRDQL